MQPSHYLVWRKNGGRKPCFRHETIESAMAEAERLAKETRAKFVVLAAITEVLPPQVEQESQNAQH